MNVRIITVQEESDTLREDDEDMLQRIFVALADRITADPYAWDGAYARQIAELPAGLRAMAATHDLVVSLSRGDLGWHFSKCGEGHHVQETENGLWELDLPEFAELFREAYAAIRPYLPEIRKAGDYAEWIRRAGPLDRILALTQEASRIDQASEESTNCGAIHAAWIRYTRAHLERVFPE